MNHGRIVFSQIMDYFPRRCFKSCVDRYGGDHRVRRFTCLDQFYCMSFAQLTGRESLRDIETCLRAIGPKLYHAGTKARVSRTTLAKANELRDWKIYRDLALILIEQARALYARQPLAMNLKRAVYALDSTVVDLCLSLFPWAQHRRHKSAVKVHTQLDLRGNIPAFIRITAGHTHDVHFLDHLIFEAGAFYIMDKGYIDFQRLYHIHQQRSFFVIRAKNNLAFSRQTSRAVDKNRGLRSDTAISSVALVGAGAVGAGEKNRPTAVAKHVVGDRPLWHEQPMFQLAVLGAILRERQDPYHRAYFVRLHQAALYDPHGVAGPESRILVTSAGQVHRIRLDAHANE